MGTKSRESIYGASIRASAERAREARKEADRLACQAWNQRMLGYQGPAQPSPALGDALNAGYRYLEVRCLGCDTHQTVALDIVRRPKTTPIHELERYMRCKDCSALRGFPYKRSHLVALRATKISASDPPSTWWPEMSTVKTIVLLIAVPALALGPALAQQVQLQSAVEIDCSAYERNANGSWVVLRPNKIFERGKVMLEVVPGNDLEKSKDGAWLYRLLNASCPRTKP
jgi:hypothetical protein